MPIYDTLGPAVIVGRQMGHATSAEFVQQLLQMESVSGIVHTDDFYTCTLIFAGLGGFDYAAVGGDDGWYIAGCLHHLGPRGGAQLGVNDQSGGYSPRTTMSAGQHGIVCDYGSYADDYSINPAAYSMSIFPRFLAADPF